MSTRVLNNLMCLAVGKLFGEVIWDPGPDAGMCALGCVNSPLGQTGYPCHLWHQKAIPQSRSVSFSYEKWASLWNHSRPTLQNYFLIVNYLPDKMRMLLIFAIMVVAVAAAATIEDGAQLEAADRIWLSEGDSCWHACGRKGGLCHACHPHRYIIHNTGTYGQPGTYTGRCCWQGQDDTGCKNVGCPHWHCCAWMLMGKFWIILKWIVLTIILKSNRALHPSIREWRIWEKYTEMSKILCKT